MNSIIYLKLIFHCLHELNIKIENTKLKKILYVLPVARIILKFIIKFKIACLKKNINIKG